MAIDASHCHAVDRHVLKTLTTDRFNDLNGEIRSVQLIVVVCHVALSTVEKWDPA